MPSVFYNSVVAGVDPTMVKGLLGHKTTEMTTRSSHLSPLHKRQAGGPLEDQLDNNMDTGLGLAEEVLSQPIDSIQCPHSSGG